MSDSSNVQVQIVEGVLAKFQADVIVNSTNRALCLQFGGLSKSLLKEAGKELQEECSHKHRDGVTLGDIVITKGYGLTCKHVYHGSLPSWDTVENVDPSQILEQFVTSSLNQAHDDKMTSIAFPSLGCGFLDYPPLTAAGIMYSAIAIFISSHPITTLVNIYIVIFTKGGDSKHIKQAFMRELTGVSNNTINPKRSLKDVLASSRKAVVPKQSVKISFSETCIKQRAINSCSKKLRCGHACGGMKNERRCPPCLQKGCVGTGVHSGDEDCSICYTDPLSAAPVIMLKCGHIFHLHCIERVLNNKWVGPRLTFAFMMCPLCKEPMEHEKLAKLLGPHNELKQDVQRKALMRAQYEGLDKSAEVTSNTSPYYKDVQRLAMDRYCYYPCFKCRKAYFGGTVECGAVGEDNMSYNEKDLVCAACSGVDRNAMCKVHGTDFIAYKCRFCCSFAIYFCFGDTHFCDTCHSQYSKMRFMDKNKLPKCPAGPAGKQLHGKCPLNLQHPPGGTEFCLGCAMCANMKTF